MGREICRASAGVADNIARDIFINETEQKKITVVTKIWIWNYYALYVQSGMASYSELGHC